MRSKDTKIRIFEGKPEILFDIPETNVGSLNEATPSKSLKIKLDFRLRSFIDLRLDFRMNVRSLSSSLSKR
ncbi:hypothetical protein BES34_013590 [Leptospira inadai serovar Lyme]|uniref:Uncharacterized protein n=1 Tax=Leptospira inadai serovar Lyme TaxID=293084 RepID=A0ABX4YGK3_9LEPT|nr:hypothetical protein BES34_013590 [Leptospira inadai serovar Lyme]